MSSWHELHQRFVTRLASRVVEMRDVLGRAASADVEALMHRFHSLAGIGGTYGYPEITRFALRGEQICAAAVEADRSLTAAEAHEAGECITAIADADVMAIEPSGAQQR
jgi:HPt (histidine-containing phosphotransfer) domain-containing protein